jgi:hypothetical protein
VLPAPDLPWGGKIGLNAAQSASWWQPRIVPPAGAPNVLLIMTDDVGFAAVSRHPTRWMTSRKNRSKASA